VLAPTPFFADRGCHVRIYEEVRLLQDLGWYVEVVTYHNGRDMPGVFTRRTPNLPWYRKLGPGPSYHKLYLDLLLLFRAMRVVREIRPKIIHAHLHEGAFLGVILGKLFRIPCVADLQGSLTKELSDYKFAGHNRLVYRLLQAIEGWVDRSSHHLLVSSDAMIEDLRDRFGVSPERITLVKDGVGRGFFDPEETGSVPAALRPLRKREGDRVVVFLGVLTRLQGIEILMEAIPRVLDRVDDVSFLVIGFPDHERFARRLAKEGHRERVTFTGRMPYLEISQALARAQLALSPKISETEGNGKLFNYMAAGLPTIVFDNAVNREILGEEGIYVTERTPEAYADAIVATLADPEEADRRGRALKMRARERSDWALNRELLVRVYGSLAPANGESVAADPAGTAPGETAGSAASPPSPTAEIETKVTETEAG
jgi:glycosyltransferase involved in cell wall biosynthesis